MVNVVVLNNGPKETVRGAYRFSESSVKALENLKARPIYIPPFGDATEITLQNGGAFSSHLFSVSIPPMNLHVYKHESYIETELKPDLPASFVVTVQIWLSDTLSVWRSDRIDITSNGIEISEVAATTSLPPGASAWANTSVQRGGTGDAQRIQDLADEILAFYETRKNERPSVLMEAATRLASPWEPSYDQATVVIFKETYGARIHDARDVFKAAGLDTSGLDIHNAMRAERVYGFGYTLKHRASKL